MNHAIEFAGEPFTFATIKQYLYIASIKVV